MPIIAEREAVDNKGWKASDAHCPTTADPAHIEIKSRIVAKTNAIGTGDPRS